MAKRKTHEEFMAEVSQIEFDFEVLGKYVDSRTKIKCRHLTCDKIVYVRPDRLLLNKGCKDCGFKYGKKPSGFLKSQEQFDKEVMDLVGTEYTFLEGYINSETEIKCVHNKCGHVYYVKPANFLSGRGCKNCVIQKQRKDHDEFVKEVHELSNGNVKVIGEYITARDKIEIEVDGKIRNVQAYSILDQLKGI